MWSLKQPVVTWPSALTVYGDIRGRCWCVLKACGAFLVSICSSVCWLALHTQSMTLITHSWWANKANFFSRRHRSRPSAVKNSNPGLRVSICLVILFTSQLSLQGSQTLVVRQRGAQVCWLLHTFSCAAASFQTTEWTCWVHWKELLLSSQTTNSKPC